MKVAVTKIRMADDYPKPERDAIKLLAASIQRDGLKEPIELMGPDMQSGLYQLVNGRARLSAVMRLGLDSIPATVQPLPPGESVRGGTFRSNGNFQPTYKETPRRIAANEAMAAMRRAEAHERRFDLVLPHLKRGVPTGEIADMIGASRSTVTGDRAWLIDNGYYDPPEGRSGRNRVSSRSVTGRAQTLRVLTNSALALEGVVAGLDNLHPEDLELLEHGEWEVTFKDAIRAMNRVRRSVGNGSDDSHD